MADGYVYDWDPEKLIQCPYDKNHQIRACRFPYHIVKCRKNHPDIVQQLMTCPFNARHQVHREAMSQHIARCEDRTLIEQDIASQSDNYRKEPTMVNMWQPPPCEEDWDKDLEGESKSVFIWGKDRCETDRTGRIMGCKSHLHSGLRIPSSLPSVLPRKSTSQSDNYRKELNVVSARQPPPCEENWDKDLEGESKSAFVWDKNRCETDRSDTVMGYKSQLHSGLHVPSPLPSLLPWKSSAGN